MNDWIVANITNPDFSISDFKNIADMSLNNTLMLKRNDYLKSDFIKNNPLFKNNNGEFSEDKFNLFYNKKLNEFLEFQTGLFPSGLELDMFDTDRTANTKVRDNRFFLGKGINPDRLKVGIEGINVWSNPEYSRSEIAQMNKVWDTEKGEYKDYSPNDRALFNGKKDYGSGFFSSLFEEPLVMAQWEEEGTHIDPLTGRERKHQKGDYKLNDEGTYYYETLNGRSPIGKLVLSALDTITVDGTGINKYDFFDSDDIEKSVGGVIAKNVVTLLPMFLGGPIGTAYSAALIAREMSKSLPMLYGIATSLFGDNEAPKWMNSVAAMGEKFTSGTSDYAKEHTFSVENFGNLISDVALQWGQQKTIAKAIDKLRGSKNYVEDAMKNAKALYGAKATSMGALAAENPENWMNSPLGQACIKKFLPEAEKAAVKAGQLGRDASLAYMAIISNSDVFGDAILHGATRGEAAAIALGSTLGMFAVDKYLGLGEVFFDDATGNSVKAARQAVKKELLGYTDSKGVFHSGAAEIFLQIKQSNDSLANKILRMIKAASDKSKKVLGDFSDDLKYHTTGFIGKAIGEGTEEVSEELISDAAKSIYELAGRLGADTSVSDVGAWDNAMERYSMSFLGGAIGGGIFYGKELWDGKSFKRDKSNEELATLIRNGHTSDLRDAVDKLRRSGKAGSTKLSAYDYERVETEDGKSDRVWLTTKDLSKSQNQKIADMIDLKITAIDAIINNNQVGLSDDLLFLQMVLSEGRFARYLEVAPITNYYLDFNNILGDLILAEINLKAASATIDGTPKGTIMTDEARRGLSNEELTARAANIQLALLKVDDLRNKRNLFLGGDSSLDYTRKLNFAIDPILHSLFLAIDTELLWQKTFGDKKSDELSKEELEKFWLETLPREKQAALKEKLTASWERYKQIEKLVAPELANVAVNTPLFKKWSEQFLKIIDGGALDPLKLLKSYLSPDDKMDLETDEQYQVRNTKTLNPITGLEETDEEFNLRKALRNLAIDLVNDQKDLEWVSEIMNLLSSVNYIVDPITLRSLHRIVPLRVRDVLLRKLLLTAMPNSSREVLKGINSDLSNVDEILLTLRNSNSALLKSNVVELLNVFANSEVLDIYGDLISLREYFETDGAGLTVDDILSDSTLIGELDDEAVNDIVDSLGRLRNVVGGNVEVDWLLLNRSLIDFDEAINPSGNTISNEMLDVYNNYKVYADLQFLPILNSAQLVILGVQSSAFFKLKDNILGSLKNPIVELVKLLASLVLDEKVVPEIEQTLQKIDEDYQNIDDVSSMVLDESLLGTLSTTKDILKLVGTYLYAASSTSTMNTPIGHNKVMNEFARNHADVMENWEELPEIDSDYATIYQQQLNQYVRELDSWIDLSNRNTINKRAQFEKTDKAFNKSLWDLVQNKLNANAFKVEIDDKLYNLLDGVGDIDTSLSTTDLVAVPLFETEKLLYTNFQNALRDSGLNVHDFLEKTGLLDKLVSIPSILDLRISLLTGKMAYENLTDYDKILYFAQVLTLNPVDFYILLKGKVDLNKNIAPITALEYASKLAIAASNLQFRDIIKYAFEKSGDDRYLASNTTIVTGVAGAGKTLVTGKAVKDFLGNESITLAVGPTDTLALALLKSLGLSESHTIPNLFKRILGEQLYSDLKSDIETIEWNNVTNKFNKESKFFSAWEGADGIAKFKLKGDAPIIFKELDKIPNVLIVDEATHLSSVEALVLDSYMKSVGGELILIGDSNQRGYHGSKSLMGNIRDVDFFAVRTPKLTVSLRDNNILKQSNLEAVRTLLDLVLDNIVRMSESELKGYWPTAQSILSKFNFKVFNEEEINGDLITNSITPEIIAKINKEGKSIGFIGNKNLSAAYTALQNAGLTDKVTTLSMDEMLGLEFDYVIIDLKLEKPEDGILVRNFLQDLYTLMSRGREASIFVDNSLSNIIGKNILSKYLAKAPSLTDEINGVTAIDELRNKKLKILDQFDLTPLDIEGKPINPNPVNPDLDFVDPDTLNIDLMADLLILLAELEEVTSLSNSTEEYVSSEFTIPSWGDVTYMGVEVGKEQSRTGKDGKEHKSKSWVIKKSSSEPLRNLAAIKNDGEEAFWFADKIKWQKDLFLVKSVLIYNHSWEETRLGTGDKILPVSIRSNFNKADWENGTYELEIRSTDGEVLPLFAPMKEIGFEYNGERYIANIVFKVKNKSGLDCIFDLAGINNPNTLITHLPEIKANITNKLSGGKLTAEEAIKLTNILNTVDNLASKYKNMFDFWINLYNKDGKFSLNISKAIRHSKTTWFKQRQGLPIRLGGRIDPNAVTDTSNFKNLKDLNPGMVFSDVYTYASKELTEIDQSLRGKAVVFVSSDTLLRPDELIKTYINLKKDPLNNRPVVRMLVLGNYGMSLSQLYDPKFIKSFQSGNEERKPLRQNFLGILMFTSMWNYRASLALFSNALSDWKAKNNYSDDKVSTIMRALHEIYDKSLTGDAKSAYLKLIGLTNLDISNLENFNLEDCKNIPMFRLGYSILEDNGFHIQLFDVTGSTAYNDAKANLIVVTPEKANLFYILSNKILLSIVSSDTRSSLGLEMLKEDGSKWSIDETIDLKQASHRRTLSNLLKFNKDLGLVVTFDGKSIAYPKGLEWSAIPGLVSSIIRTVTYYLYNPDLLSNSELESAKIYLHNLNTGLDKEVHFVETLIGHWLSGPLAILKTRINSKAAAEQHPDRSLTDMFELMFHGTTLDVHQSGALKASDARFKDGFFINPDISRKKTSAGDYELVPQANGNILFYNIETSDELFTCNVDLRAAGIGLSIDSLVEVNSDESSPSLEEVIQEEPFPLKYPMAAELIEKANAMGEEFDADESSIDDVVDFWNRKTLPSIVQNILVDGEEALGYVTYYKHTGSNDVEPMTLQLYLISLLPVGERIDKISIDNGKVMIKSTTNKYILNKDNFSLEKETPEPTPTTTRFSLKVEYDGKLTSVKNALGKILHDNEFINEFDEDIVNEFLTEINNIISLDGLIPDDTILALLKGLKNNEDYDDILIELEDNYNELYNKIFEC